MVSQRGETTMNDIEWTVESLGPKIDDFLNPVLDAADFDIDYDIFEVKGPLAVIGPELMVDFEGKDAGLLLHRRAELLLALEQLTLEALRIPHQDRYRLIFDVNDYRMNRIDELCTKAKAAAEQVKKTGKPYKFRPMTSRERRIVHVTLTGDDAITTLSEGTPPNRYTVVEPSDSTES